VLVVQMVRGSGRAVFRLPTAGQEMPAAVQAAWSSGVLQTFSLVV
jgi:hypothetical protein